MHGVQRKILVNEPPVEAVTKHLLLVSNMWQRGEILHSLRPNQRCFLMFVF